MVAGAREKAKKKFMYGRKRSGVAREMCAAPRGDV